MLSAFFISIRDVMYLSDIKSCNCPGAIYTHLVEIYNCLGTECNTTVRVQYTSIRWQYATCQLPIDDILVFVLILLIMLNIYVYQDSSMTASILIRSTQGLHPVHTVTIRCPYSGHTVTVPCSYCDCTVPIV